MEVKRFLFFCFFIGMLFLPLCAEDTYSLHVKTKRGDILDLNFIHNPVVSFDKDSVIISTEDLKLMFCYGDVVLSFVDNSPNSITDNSHESISFSINQETVTGVNIPPSCVIRFFSMRGELLEECKPDNLGIVRYSINNKRDKILIVNIGQVGLSFKLLIP